MIIILIYTVLTVWMTVAYFRAVEDGGRVGFGFKMCVLIFVSVLSGILMLADNGH